ncbi:MAG: mechanosensitive ion channel family protein [bacterium]
MFDQVLAHIGKFVPLLATLAVVALSLWTINFFTLRNQKLTTGSRLPRQLIMLSLFVISIIAVILALPIPESTQSDLLSLLGLVLTGIIALSSTSFVSNAMAGLMLRSVKSFRQGDFIRVESHFGRVTERGLFHTEIQTEDRDLVTLPNLFLATNPVTVVRSSGTIISCDLSLGYDVPYYKIREILKKAAEAAELQEPFVQVMALGDFAISYRVSGYYPEVKHLLSTRSHLKEEVLDHLHKAGVEIVSPTFMNQRQVGDQKFVSPPRGLSQDFAKKHPAPESLIFDKADLAEKIHILEEERKLLEEEIKGLSDDKSNELSPEEIKNQTHLRKQRIESLNIIIEKAKEKKEH